MVDHFSPKQLEALTWWCRASPHRRRDAIICDGAVRSGKTLSLSLSFVLWSMEAFRGQSFALCGKTVTSLARNLLQPLLGLLEELGYPFAYRPSKSLLEIGLPGRRNRYYLFGGRDEGSAALIQGVTLAGVLLDEVALMPRSFVEQALARCSVEGSKFFFNCNPEHPGHWFYTQWIQQSEAKNALYLHFTMADNPSLTPKVRARYETLYTGVFHDRYVKGKWVAVQGAVYPMFSREHNVIHQVPACTRFFISCDYGTVNPASFGLWGRNGDRWIRLREYYHDSRSNGCLLTDEEYCDALERLAGDFPIEAVIVDPSAASFLQCIRRRGRFPVIPAKNNVADGIRLVSGALKSGKLLFHESCVDCIREFGLYRWADGASADVPRKEDDHAMDDMRYFAMHVLGGGTEAGWAVASVAR